uniref:Uncharacterized protein n=1 Tax=Phaseolus vulgaris TaxID=3885 RepID=V7BYS2_PHAVU|nr:hypothetical protein PHAVU_005G136200g [Phaseolus vulgaris]ESW22208.1 hypothetical protein PHAVU_005G136200g [Phaseolus vulgaris]
MELEEMRDLGMRIIAGFDNWFRFLKDRRNLDNGFQLPLRNFNFLLPNSNEEKTKEASTQTVNAAKDSAASSAKSDKDAAAPAVDAAAPGASTEESETFGQWAYEKFTSGLGLRTTNKE